MNHELKIIITRLKHIFINQNRNQYNNTFLPMRNKFVYSYKVKIHVLQFNELLESIFCLLLVVEVFCLQKVIKVLEEVVICCQAVRWIWQMRQNFIAQFIQLEALVVWREVGCCHGEELGPFCWPVPAVGIAVFGPSHWVAEHTSQM